MPNSVNKEDYLDEMANQISNWGVGFIVGAGFSKEVVGDEAKNWKELFQALILFINEEYFADEQEIFSDEVVFLDIEEELSNGNTLPQIATKICKRIADKTGKTYEESKNEIKMILRSLVDWVPSKKSLENYKNILYSGLNAKWFITTNYDEVLEAIFGEDGYTLNPDEPLVAPDGRVPIYHIHGSRNDYNDLIVTHEDYVPLFEPGTYRETKLLTMMSESPIIILGYSLSDLNLLAAITQSGHLFKKHKFKVLLANYSQTNSSLVSITENGYDEIEIEDINEFLNDLENRVFNKIVNNRKKKEEATSFYSPIKSFVMEVEKKTISSGIEEDYVEYVPYNLSEISKLMEDILPADLRSGITKDKLKEFKKYSNFQLPTYQTIFNKYLMTIMQYHYGKSRTNGGFEYYGDLLEFILNILDLYDVTWLSPRLMKKITQNLDYVLGSKGNELGKSHRAERIWKEKAPDFFRNNRELWDAILLQSKIDSSQNAHGYPGPRWKESVEESFEKIEQDELEL